MIQMNRILSTSSAKSGIPTCHRTSLNSVHSPHSSNAAPLAYLPRSFSLPAVPVQPSSSPCLIRGRERDRESSNDSTYSSGSHFAFANNSSEPFVPLPNVPVDEREGTTNWSRIRNSMPPSSNEVNVSIDWKCVEAARQEDIPSSRGHTSPQFSRSKSAGRDPSNRRDPFNGKYSRKHKTDIEASLSQDGVVDSLNVSGAKGNVFKAGGMSLDGLKEMGILASNSNVVAHLKVDKIRRRSVQVTVNTKVVAKEGENGQDKEEEANNSDEEHCHVFVDEDELLYWRRLAGNGPSLKTLIRAQLYSLPKTSIATMAPLMLWNSMVS
ncbi:hypothetical protein BJ741DRAFT_210461 [Chytriomyces cf. hyalinus JEL632]|nr:hypothetical protein BJ741DRAFT_210461 [Chytriomyces cf. hyalinus JEL632]